MKLSMSILEAWLERYDPTSIIKKDSMSIENFFLLPTTQSGSSAALYVGRTRDLFPESESEEVVLVHMNNVISLKTADLVDVFNSASSAFAFYNRWEDQLAKAAQTRFPEQSIIDACNGVVGPITICDLKLETIAISKGYPRGSVNPYFDSFGSDGGLSYDLLARVIDTAPFKNPHNLLEGYVYHEERVGQWPYALISSYLSDNGEPLGYVIISVEKRPTQKDRDLSQVIVQALNSARFKPVFAGKNDIVSAALLSLLTHPADRRAAQMILDACEWDRNDSFVIAAFIQDKRVASKSWGSLTIGRLAAHYEDAVVVQEGETFFCCFNLVHSKKIKKRVEASCRSLGLVAGISNPCWGIEGLYQIRRQADIAVGDGRGHQLVTRFSECALSRLMDEHDDKFKEACLHPAIRILLAHDASSRSDLLETLSAFVRHERRYQQTASVLHVHRNTVIKRISAITELLGTSFEDPYEREYLLYSLRYFEEHRDA